MEFGRIETPQRFPLASSAYPNVVTLGDMPNRASVDEYRDAMAAVVKRTEIICPQAGVYDFGHVGCVGLSDIDVLFVIPPEADSATCVELVNICLKQKHFFHGPMIGTAITLQELGWMLPGIETRHIAGPDMLDTTDKPDANDLYDVSAADIIEGAIARWFWFQNIVAHGPVDPRRAMLGLWALRRLVLYKERAGLSVDSDDNSFCGGVLKLRQQWSVCCQLDRSELVSLIEDASIQAEKIMREVSSAVTLWSCSKPVGKILANGKIILRRSSEDCLLTQQYRIVFGRRRRTYHLIDLPHAVFDMMWSWHRPGRIHSNDETSIAKRHNAIQRYGAFVLQMKLDGAATPPGMLGRPARGIAMRFADKVMAHFLARSA